VVRWLVLFGGLVGIAVAVRAGADELDGSALPSPPALVGIFACCIVSSMSAARAWSSALPVSHPADARRTFYVSQLSKYLPVGGVAQAAAQMSLTVSSGIGAATTAAAWAVAVLCSMVAAAFVGAGVAFQSEAPAWLRVVALLAPVLVLLLHERVLRWCAHLAFRAVPRLERPIDLPPPRATATCLAWSTVSMLAFSIAHGVAMGSLVPEVDELAVVSAAALAWLAGFAVVILPGGLGVREAVLVAVVDAPSAALLAASLAVRLGLLLSETILAGTSWLAGRRRQAGGGPSGWGMQSPSSSATTMRSRLSHVISLVGSTRTLYSRKLCSSAS
jgi:uncharacterized membrane protein YbhN (UPF0104 family)